MKENSKDLVEFHISSEKLNTMVRKLEKVAKKLIGFILFNSCIKGIQLEKHAQF